MPEIALSYSLLAITIVSVIQKMMHRKEPHEEDSEQAVVLPQGGMLHADYDLSLRSRMGSDCHS